MKLEEAMKTLLDFIRCAEEEFGKVKYTSTSMNVDDGDIEAISTILQELDRLQKENEDFRRLEKDHNYSVPVIRENSKLRYELAHSVSCDKIREKIEEYKNSKEFYQNFPDDYMGDIAISLLQDLIKEE